MLLYPAEGEGRQDPHSALAYYSHCDFLKHFSQRLPKESFHISDPQMKYKNQKKKKKKYKNQIDGCFVYCSVKLHY